MRHLSYITLILAGFLSYSCTQESAPITQTEEGRFFLGGAVAEETVTRTVAPEGRKLEISNENGNVTVIGSDDEVAHITFNKYAKGSKEDNRAGLHDIKIEEQGGDLYYRYNVSHASRADQSRVDIMAVVPGGTPLSLLLKNSHVEIASFHGPVTIENRNGSISITGSSGEVKARTKNGHIDVEVSDPTLLEWIDVQTENGSIKLTLPAVIDADVEASTSVGDITATGLPLNDVEFHETSVGASYEGYLGAGGGKKIKATTSTGDISFKVYMPKPVLLTPGENDSTSVSKPDTVNVDVEKIDMAVPAPNRDSIKTIVE